MKLCITCRHCHPYVKDNGVGYHCRAVFKSLVDGVNVVFDASHFPQQAWSARQHFCGVSAYAWEAKHTCPVCSDDLTEVPGERCASCDKPVCEQCSGEWLIQCKHCGEYYCWECIDRPNVEPVMCMECAGKEDEEALR